jgi:hypothetical protein
MTLQFVRSEFKECPTCAAKPGAATLCHECLERRELYGLLEALRRSTVIFDVKKRIAICQTCQGNPDPECKEHGR